MRIKIWGFQLPLVAVLFTLTACESYLYYPDQKFYYDPAKSGLKPEEVWFTSDDQGKKLHGWYFHSLLKSTSKALLIFFHGNAQNLTAHWGALSWIPSYNYDYFIFDYQGYGQSEGSPSTESTLLDGHAAVEWAHANHPDLPLVIFSQSLGGAIALRTLIDLKDQIPIKLIVAESTFSSYVEIVKYKLQQMNLFWALQKLSPSDDYAPGDKLSEISPVPIVVIHGDQDPVVDISFGKEIYEKSPDPKQFWLVPGGKHIEAFYKYRDTFAPKLLDELDQVLK